VNASADPAFCKALSSRLGGRLSEQKASAPTTTPAPTTTRQPTPTSTTPPPPPPPPPPAVSGAQENALRAARDYLDYTAFSRQGLIDQLLYEGFTPDQAEYGVAQEYD
jgi:hypothetical protein